MEDSTKKQKAEMVQQTIVENKSDDNDHSLSSSGSDNKEHTLPIPKSETNVKKIGILCVSPGLQVEDMDDKMLSTLEMSKTIEKSQKGAILNNLNDGNNVHKIESNVIQNGQQQKCLENLSSPLEKNEQGTSRSGKFKELKHASLNRKFIPKPLSLSDSSSLSSRGMKTAILQGKETFIHTGTPSIDRNSLKSAPACVTKYSLRRKPRVQYIGRTPKNPFPKAGHMYPRLNQHQRQASLESNRQFMTQQNPYYQFISPGTVDPYGYPPQYMQYSMQHHLPPNFMGYTPQSPVPGGLSYNFPRNPSMRYSPNRHIFPNNQRQEMKIPSRPREELRRKSVSMYEDSDDEDTSLALDEEDMADFRPHVNSIEKTEQVINGELCLLGHEFKFEIPQSATKLDKKIFLSVCDKVWDDTLELENNSR